MVHADPRPARVARHLVLVTATVLMGLTAGCGYNVGNGFPPEIRTIHIPTFTSESFRRGFELQLTEAVQNQIKLRTQFRLVNGSSPADTRLVGHIREIGKNTISETQFDDVRESELFIGVDVQWIEVRSGRILAQQIVPLGPAVAQIALETSFAPEVGQSLATARQDAVEQLAQQIVGMMEAPW